MHLNGPMSHEDKGVLERTGIRFANPGSFLLEKITECSVQARLCSSLFQYPPCNLAAPHSILPPQVQASSSRCPALPSVMIRLGHVEASEPEYDQ